MAGEAMPETDGTPTEDQALDRAFCEWARGIPPEHWNELRPRWDRTIIAQGIRSGYALGRVRLAVFRALRLVS